MARDKRLPCLLRHLDGPPMVRRIPATAVWSESIFRPVLPGSQSMNVTRAALLVPLLAVVALTGCRTRGASNAAVTDELRAENQRLTGVVTQLQRENDSLMAQLQSARDALAKN